MVQRIYCSCQANPFMKPQPAHKEAASPNPGDLAVVGLLLVSLVAYFWDFLLRQGQWAIQQTDDWGHTLIAPLIAAWFLRRAWPEIESAGARICWWGILPLAFGLMWYAACIFGPSVLHHHNLRGFGVVCSLGGLGLLLLGPTSIRHLVFPMIFLFVFGQTISERLMAYVTHPMQSITAFGAHLLLVLGTLDAEREGNVIRIYVMGDDMSSTIIPLNVAEACSGMRMLMAFLAIGTTMAFVSFQRWWQRIFLIGSAFPVALVVNIVRVLVLGLLSLIDPDLGTGEVHTMVGVFLLVPAWLLFLGVAGVLKRLVVDSSDDASKVGMAP